MYSQHGFVCRGHLLKIKKRAFWWCNYIPPSSGVFVFSLLQQINTSLKGFPWARDSHRVFASSSIFQPKTLLKKEKKGAQYPIYNNPASKCQTQLLFKTSSLIPWEGSFTFCGTLFHFYHNLLAEMEAARRALRAGPTQWKHLSAWRRCFTVTQAQLMSELRKR